MTEHLTDDVLQAYIDGEADCEERIAASAHLAADFSERVMRNARNTSIAAGAMSNLRTLPVADGSWMRWLRFQKPAHCYEMVALLLGGARAHVYTNAR